MLLMLCHQIYSTGIPLVNTTIFERYAVLIKLRVQRTTPERTFNVTSRHFYLMQQWIEDFYHLSPIFRFSLQRVSTKHMLYFSSSNYISFAIKNNFNFNYGVKYKSDWTNQNRVNVCLNVNQNILHMRQAKVREPVEEQGSTFDLVFC